MNAVARRLSGGGSWVGGGPCLVNAVARRLSGGRVRRIRFKNLFASKRIKANLDLIRLFHIFRIPHLFASFAYIRLKIFASICFENCT